MQQDDDDWLTRLQKKMTSSQTLSPEQVAEYAAERKAEENTKLEWAHLKEDGKIAFRISVKGENGGHGASEFVVSPGEDSYEKCLLEYDLKLPGDTISIKKRLLDGQWVVETTEKINTKDATG